MSSQWQINSVLIISLSMILSSCFKEDERLPPYSPPEGINSMRIESSMYYNHIFIDFDNNIIPSIYENTSWQLGFECSPNGYHVIVNSSDFWGISKSENTNLADTKPSVFNWQFDYSNGNLDSTAIGEWIEISNLDTTINPKIFYLGQYNGIKYTPYFAFRFSDYSKNSYTVEYINLQDNLIKNVVIEKDTLYNFVYYSFEKEKVEYLEPAKSDWDIEFTQYATILLDNEGIPTPYYVRGVFLNPNKVLASVDSTADFLSWSYDDALTSLYSDKKDFIGHEWKDVSINEGSNTASYKVNPNLIYTIKDPENNYFKLRFTSYHNDLGQKGYPSFEFSKLNE